jgi:hypothetical protein
MARLNFIKGSIKGRVGEFVGSSWKGTDKAIAVIYDEASEKALAAVGERQDDQITVPIGSIEPGDMSKLHAYLVFSKPPAANTAGQSDKPLSRGNQGFSDSLNRLLDILNL